MAKLFHATARLTLGATLAGFIVGVCEAAYWHASLLYAALGYSALFGLLAACLGPVMIALATARPGPVHRLTTTPFGRGAFVMVLSFCALVLVRFILWRDVYVEAPDKALLALSWGAAAGGITAMASTLVFVIAAHLLKPRDAYNSTDDATAPRFAARLVWLPSLCLWTVFGLWALWGMALPHTPQTDIDRTGRDAGHSALVSMEAQTATPMPADAASAPLSVILIIADALRADALTSYGAPDVRGHSATPNFARFAQGALQFDNAVAQASWTKPAVASIMTSLPPSVHQTMAKGASLPDSMPTLAQVLQQHDISTSAVITNYNLARIFGFHRGFDAYDYLAPDRYLGAPPEATRLTGYNMYRLLRERFFAAGRRPETFYQSAQTVNHHALSLLSRIGQAPFFMWLHYMEPHDPYFSDDGTSFARVANPHPKASEAKAMHAAYSDSVRRMDTAFGQLWEALVSRGIDKRCLVIVVADHGEEFGEHDGYYHGTSLYESLVHIPLLLRGPRIAPGRSATLVQQMDLAPTIARYLHAPVAQAWHGRDIMDAAHQAPAVSRAEQDQEGNRLVALRGGSLGERHKVIEANADNPRGLPARVAFDLVNDPDEQHPIQGAQSDAWAQALQAFAHLQDDAIKARGHMPAIVPRTKPLPVDGEAQLRALGYVQ